MSRLGTVLALIGITLTFSACGYNTIPTLQEQAKARGRMCRTSIKGAPT